MQKTYWVPVVNDEGDWLVDVKAENQTEAFKKVEAQYPLSAIACPLNETYITTE